MKSNTLQDYLDRICRVLHFHRVFSGLVGESLAEHIRRLRLERAAGELCRTNRRVIDVALAAGYGAHEPFTRAFRAHFGMPPSAWREAGEPLVFPPVLCGVHYGPDEAVSDFVALEEDTKMIEVHIENVPARRLLALSHDSKAIGIYYDDPETKPNRRAAKSRVRDGSGFENEPPPGFEWLDLPGGEIAFGLHKGPYDQLVHSYRWLFSSVVALEWARSRGPAVLRNVFERCEDDAARGSDDADLDSFGGSV
jgi:AraC family transcriptional regulator